MSYEVSRRSARLARVEEEQEQRELFALSHRAELGVQRVVGINRVAQRAIFETMVTGVIRQKAELIAPDGAEIYAMIAMAAGVGCTQVVSNVYAPRRRGSVS